MHCNCMIDEKANIESQFYLAKINSTSSQGKGRAVNLNHFKNRPNLSALAAREDQDVIV